MTGANIAVKILDDEMIDKLCKKWPRRILLQAVFGSKELFQTRLNCHFGQFVLLETKNDNNLNLRAYTSSEFKNPDCIFVHKDVGLIISDEIITTITPLSGGKICKNLQLRVQDAKPETKDLKSYVSTALKDCPVQPTVRYIIPYYGKSVIFEVISVKSSKDLLCDELSSMSIQTSTPKRSMKAEACRIITEITEIEILDTSDNCTSKVTPKNLRIGGVNEELNTIRKAVDSLNSSKNYIGILLYGPSGTGKTLLANVVMNELTDFCRININGAEVYSRYSGETEERLRNLFHQTQNFEKSVLFIDEFDVLTSSNSEQERRVNASIKVLMDFISELQNHKILLLATSSRSDMIEASFRRPGRLDLEIELPIPNVVQRTEIIQIFKEKFNANLSDEDIKVISQNAHGYVGADLEALIAQASLNGQNDKKSCLEALKLVKPSAMREVQVSVPNVTWEDIGGLDDLKDKLIQAVHWPIKHPEVFRKMGINPPKGT